MVVSGFEIREAREEDRDTVRGLLIASALPTAGLRSTRLFVLIKHDAVVGAVGYEDYAPYALLRSLVVAPEVRDQGGGGELLETVLAEAKREGLQKVYALTTTIPEWLSRSGFVETTRSELPRALYASAELQGACPDTARVFRRTL